MYFDTHAHYDDEKFDSDRTEVLAGMQSAGVDLILNPGCSLESSQTAVALSERYAFLWAAVGVHPEECGGFDAAALDTLSALAQSPRVKAIGEIGLDYHYPDNPPREVQRDVFRTQLELALSLNLPVIIHDRDAHADCLRIVSDYPALRGVFHCFSGSPEMARQLLTKGWHLGFDGPVTYQNAKRVLDVLAITPTERILLETDAPYLPPVPHRGERNDSRLLPFIARAVAAGKGVSEDELARIAKENGKRLFGIS